MESVTVPLIRWVLREGMRAVVLTRTSASQAFPPTVQITAEWNPELEVLAKELAYPTTSATEIEARFCAFVELLAKP